MIPKLWIWILLKVAGDISPMQFRTTRRHGQINILNNVRFLSGRAKSGSVIIQGPIWKILPAMDRFVRKGCRCTLRRVRLLENTPHDVFLAWFGDVTDILTKAGIGYALWNFRGDFGIMDSGRKDVQYEDWHSHQTRQETAHLAATVLKKLSWQ